MNFRYDDDADVLYVTFDATLGPCRYVDTPSGAILRIDKRTGNLASITIPFFSRRANLNDLDFPELGDTRIAEGFLRSLHKRQMAL